MSERGSSMTLPDDWKRSEYGSHWWVVQRMFERFDIRSVLETGSGLYSTPLFLEQEGLERLVSIENNPVWNLELADERHTLKLVKGRVADHLPDLNDFDMVFIDDDPVSDRETTIRTVLDQPHPLVVIHDTDHEDYLPLLEGHRHQTFTRRRPWTSVVWPT